MSDAKTYTARNVRDWSDNKRVGTAPENWVRSLLRKFPDAVEVYKSKMTPYRYEPQHAQQQQRIDEAAEENGHGIPLEPVDFADKMEELSGFDCRVTLDHRTDDGKQVVKCSGGLATYKILLDPDVVRWEE